MIPETLGALIGFLGLVAPGLLFQMLREQRRPSLEQTAFREASWVALISLACTAVALGVVGLIGLAWQADVPDLSRWLLDGNAYAAHHLAVIIAAATEVVALACLIALLSDRLLRRRGGGDLVDGSIWFQQFRQRRPEGTTPWLHVRLTDGSDVWGYVGDYTPDQRLDNRELTIVGPKLRLRTKGSHVEEHLDAWASLSVRGDAIAWLKVTYINDTTGAIVPRIASRPPRRA